MKKQPETTRRNVADPNSRDFHYTQEEIDHIKSIEKENNGHFDEFPLLPNNVDDKDYPHLDQGYGGAH